MIFSHCLHTITSFSRKKSSQAKLWASHLHPNVDCKCCQSEYSTGESFAYNFFNNYAFVNTVTRNKPKYHHRIKNLQDVTRFCLVGGTPFTLLWMGSGWGLAGTWACRQAQHSRAYGGQGWGSWGMSLLRPRWGRGWRPWGLRWGPGVTGGPGRGVRPW